MTATINPIAGQYEGHVEPAVLADVPRLAELGEALHAASRHHRLSFSREKVEALLTHLINDPNGVVFVSRRDGQIVGACAGIVSPNWFGDDLIGMEYSFFVEPGARNDMRGTTLVLAFVRWCQRRGAKQVRMGITTGINEPDTAKLYRSLGLSDGGVLFTKEL